jgi:hypothetical protein
LKPGTSAHNAKANTVSHGIMPCRTTMVWLLRTHKVFAQSETAGCNASYAPVSIGTQVPNDELGHWVQHDPTVGDHVFGHAGGAGLHPWIDRTKTWQGIGAYERRLDASHLEPQGRRPSGGARSPDPSGAADRAGRDLQHAYTP